MQFSEDKKDTSRDVKEDSAKFKHETKENYSGYKAGYVDKFCH